MNADNISGLTKTDLAKNADVWRRAASFYANKKALPNFPDAERMRRVAYASDRANHFANREELQERRRT